MLHTRLPTLSLAKARRVMGVQNRARFDKIYQKIEARFNYPQREELQANLLGPVTKNKSLKDLQWHVVALVYIYSLPATGAAAREKCFAFLVKEAATKR